MDKKIENMTKSELEACLNNVETRIRELDTQVDDDAVGNDRLRWDSGTLPDPRLPELSRCRKRIEQELRKRSPGGSRTGSVPTV